MKTLSRNSDDHGCGQLKFSFQFERDGVTLNETPFGWQVDLDRCQPGGQLGGPSLPSRIVRVALPPSMRVQKVRAKCTETDVLLDGPVLVAPLQPARAGVGTRRRPPKGPEKPVRVNPDIVAHLKERPFVEPVPVPDFVPPARELYEKQAKKPAPLARLIDTEHLGLNPIAVIELNPIRLREDLALELCCNIDLTLAYGPEVAAAPEEPESEAPREAAPVSARRPITSRHQAERLAEMTRSMVVNTDMIVDLSEYLTPVITEADYLIITDNQRWDAATKTPVGAVSGDMVAEFETLASWKRQRGLKVAVVTISDIMARRYGNFDAGTRDLQEVIRNFLKHAHVDWGVAWCLLGGDTDVVPVREVVGFGNSALPKTSTEPPEKNRGFWTGSYLKLYAPGSAVNNGMLNADTGVAIPYDATGSSSASQRGWYFTTDDSYGSRSPVPTNYIRVNGPAAEVNAPILRVRHENLIPTDLYYASLVGPSYNQPGLHDWDLVDNGWYGYHTNVADSDGVEYQADVSVGRAPCGNATEAAAFVAKVTAYERFERPDGTPLSTNWTRKMLIGAANWGGRKTIVRSATSPPADNRYYHGAGADDALIKLKDPFDNLDWRLLTKVSETDIRLLPYNRAASGSSRGWHYVVSASDMSVSEITFSIFGFEFHVPMPTHWVRVFGTSDELDPDCFVFDSTNADGSMSDQEKLREQVDTELGGITDFYRLYEDDIDLTPAQKAAAPYAHLTEQRMLDKINETQHFVSLSGHGWWGGCCGYGLNTAENAANGLHSFVAYADSCSTNQFDHNDAVSEKSLVNPNGGAAAYVGNTRYSWIGVGDNFQRAFFHHLTSSRHLGLANDIRCMMVNESTGYYRRYNKWAIFALNLMGDPEMPLWLGPPRTLFANFDRELDRRKTFYVKVERTAFFGIRVPLANANVTLRQGNSLLVAKTNGMGYAQFDVGSLSLGDLDLTISKVGYRPITETIAIVGPLWVRGKVRVIHHQYRRPEQTYVQLELDESIVGDTIRGWVADRNRPDYRILLDAVTDAYISGEDIHLLVTNRNEEGGIEAFRFGDFPHIVFPHDTLVEDVVRPPLDTLEKKAVKAPMDVRPKVPEEMES